jgi:hypothetical protein
VVVITLLLLRFALIELYLLSRDTNTPLQHLHAHCFNICRPRFFDNIVAVLDAALGDEARVAANVAYVSRWSYLQVDEGLASK